MKNSFVAIFFFFFFGYTSYVYSQADSCNSSLSLSNTISFNTASLRCSSVWTSEDFTLRYLQSASNLWSFVLSAPNTNSYIAIGFSTDGNMVGSSAIVGWVQASGSGIVKQYYLGGTNENQVIPNKGNLQVVPNSTTIVSQSSRLYLAFQLNTNQPLSNLIYAVGPTGSIPSSDYYLSEHRYYISTSMNYTSDQVSTASSDPSSVLTTSHGVLNMLGWGILMLIGIIVARYFRHHDPIWFYTHTTIQVIGFALGIAGIITGFVLENSAGDVPKHKAIGLVILALGCLQVTALLARPEKTSKVRRYWNWFHHYSGRLMIILAIANVFYGIHLASGGTRWNAGYGVALGILLLSATVLEVRMWMTKGDMLGK